MRMTVPRAFAGSCDVVGVLHGLAATRNAGSVTASRWLVASAWLGAVGCGAAAYVRASGPSPVRWIVLYLAAVAASLAAGYLRRGWMAMVAIGVIAALWGGWLWAVITASVWLDERLGEVAALGGRGQAIRDALALTALCLWAHLPGWFGWRAGQAAT
jgi:hypothetical protein